MTSIGPRARLPEPSVADHAYGAHPRQVLDLWLPPCDGPHPWVVYFHGGSFRHGDKRTLNAHFLRSCLGAGLAVAGANYRLASEAPFPGPMRDAARVVQTLRSRASAWLLDASRAALTGISAGGGMALWLAFHADLADPHAEGDVAGESTRVSAVLAQAAQTSYDPRFLRRLFDTQHVDPAVHGLFGLAAPTPEDEEACHAAFVEASPLTHADRTAPATYLFYPQPDRPVPADSPGSRTIHHPELGRVLKKRLDELGVECQFRRREDVEPRRLIEEQVAFLGRI